MEISYKTKKLEKTVKNLIAIKKHYGLQAKNVSKRLEELKAAKNLEDIRNIPQARCHELKHDRKGELAIMISVNHRIIIIPDHSPIPEKKTEVLTGAK